MATAETDLDIGLAERLEARATATCQKLVALSQGSGAIARELQAKFHAAVADIEETVIRVLEEGEGAFVVESGQLIIGEEPIAKLMAFVLDDIRGEALKARKLTPDEVPELLERVFVDYVLHELRHRTQGVERYQIVQELKKACGPVVMAELDVLADRDAAMAYSALHAESDTRADFLECFREALFLSSAYFFRVFRPSPDRPDKIARAIGVLLMAARLANRDFKEPIVENDSLPLDAPLYAVLSSGQSQLAIFRAEPSKSLVQVASDGDGHDVSGLVSDIRNGDLDNALEKSITMMERLQLR